MALPIDMSSADSTEEQIFMGIINLYGLTSTTPEEERPDNLNLEYDLEEQSLTITLKLPLIIYNIEAEKQQRFKVSPFIDNPPAS